jgi:hypothetical protein
MKKEYIKIALSELRCLIMFFSCCITGMVYIKTVVKIDNIDVVLMVLLSEVKFLIMNPEKALHSK